jgi:hypothetical protein
VHVSSILTSLAHGYLQSDEVKGIENLMLLTRKVPPGSSPRDAFEVVKNADYPRFLGAITTAQESGDPKVTALRVKRPGRPPDFAADARGFLVATVFDFQLEVPVPAQGARAGAMAGPPAKVYRITSPRAEFVISFQVKPGPQSGPVHLAGRVEELDLGAHSKVFAVNEDESKPVLLTVFNAALVKGFLLARVKGQPIDVPLSNLQLRGFTIRDVSALDPSGWMRVQLIRTSASPAAGVP